MVKIYDIEKYRAVETLKTAKGFETAYDAEIIMFTGVRYERLGEHGIAMPLNEKKVTRSELDFDMRRRTSICRTNLGLNLKTV